MTVKLGFKTSQWGVDWPTLLATWELADSLPSLDSGWLFDHFSGIVDRQPTADGAHEGWTVASALAARTRRLRFGHLVLANTHRHPALLARMACTVDHVAGPDRFILGLGAGWLETEHDRFGWSLPPLAERMTMLETSVRIMKGMWSSPAGFSLVVGPYEVRDARCEPPPVTRGGPPIWLGTQGLRRGLRIVAEHADGWNANGEFAAYLEKREALLRHCEDVGRDPAEIEISAQVMQEGRTPRELVDEANRLIAHGVRHVIFLIRASGGPKLLQALADEVIDPLRDAHG